jgi:hypothetical protein
LQADGNRIHAFSLAANGNTDVTIWDVQGQYLKQDNVFNLTIFNRSKKADSPTGPF